ncbi:MAG: hypothetical protein LBV06_11115, partial [Propionibacteriaceae bacterium]|nr:hypothetical protein [Propionibacteriaceae bacterium]
MTATTDADTISEDTTNAPTVSETTCQEKDGTVVPCWRDGEPWYDTLNAYCAPWDPPANYDWRGHIDRDGNPIGTILMCARPLHDNLTILGFTHWIDTPPDTPVKPDSPINPEAIVHTMVDTLQLHPSVPGDGGFIYPNATDWGLTWWIGSPMWLSINTHDPLQWGT